MVAALGALAPARPLNEWFTAIVHAGTGKEFAMEDNARWTEVTRPILEAFFHARFFLEMAVRYSSLELPPRPRPKRLRGAPLSLWVAIEHGSHAHSWSMLRINSTTAVDDSRLADFCRRWKIRQLGCSGPRDGRISGTTAISISW